MKTIEEVKFFINVEIKKLEELRKTWGIAVTGEINSFLKVLQFIDSGES